MRTSNEKKQRERERKEKESRTFKRVDHSAQSNKNGSGTDPKEELEWRRTLREKDQTIEGSNWNCARI